MSFCYNSLRELTSGWCRVLTWSSSQAKRASQSKYDRTFVLLYNLQHTQQTTESHRICLLTMRLQSIKQARQAVKSFIDRSMKINTQHTRRVGISATHQYISPSNNSTRGWIAVISHVRKRADPGICSFCTPRGPKIQGVRGTQAFLLCTCLSLTIMITILA